MKTVVMLVLMLFGTIGAGTCWQMKRMICGRGVNSCWIKFFKSDESQIVSPPKSCTTIPKT